MILFLIILFSFTNTYAQTCPDLFSEIQTETLSPLDLALRYEEKIETLIRRSYHATKNKTLISNSLLILRSDFEEFSDGVLSGELNPDAQAALDDQIKAIERMLEKPDAMPLVSESKAITWPDLIADPSLVRAETFYTVTLHSGKTLNVLFSQPIVDQYFDTSENFRGLAGKKFLRAIQRGFVGEHESGIMKISQTYSTNKFVYKVRIIGGPIGNLRIFGFIVGNDFYITTYSESENHNNIENTRMIEIVTRSQIQRGLHPNNAIQRRTP